MKISKENRVIGDKILAGTQKAIEKLIEEAKKNNEDLVVSDKSGKVMVVSADKLFLQSKSGN